LDTRAKSLPAVAFRRGFASKLAMPARKTKRFQSRTRDGVEEGMSAGYPFSRFLAVSVFSPGQRGADERSPKKGAQPSGWLAVEDIHTPFRSVSLSTDDLIRELRHPAS
jgi:hypothetical protein